MRRILMTILLAAVALSIFAAESEKDWKFAKQTNGVTIYSRPHVG